MNKVSCCCCCNNTPTASVNYGFPPFSFLGKPVKTRIIYVKPNYICFLSCYNACYMLPCYNDESDSKHMEGKLFLSK